MNPNKNLNPKAKIVKAFLVWGFALVALGAVAAGDVGTEAVAAASDEAVGTVSAAEQSLSDMSVQTIAFQKDMRIREALTVLSERYQRNIVPSQGVEGVLPFTKLFDVTFDEAITAILGPNFKYEQEGQLIKVYTKDEYKKIKTDVDRRVYRVFTLYYITADEAVKLLGPVLSEVAKVQSSAPAEKEISGGSSTGSGGSSTGSGGGSIGSGGGGDSMALPDTVVVYDFPENIAKAEEVLKSLDRRPKQVLVEATILSALLTEGMELGVDWNFMAGFSLDGTSGTQDIVSGGTISRGTTASSPIADIKTGAGTPIETARFATAGGPGLRVGISAGDFRMFISALETVTDTTILANPKVLAVNKQEGSVLIGTNLGYRSSTTISSGGVATEGEVKFLQTGTQLVFRPYIGDDGYIRMDIYPKDSSASLNEDGVPTEQTTQLKTNIVVKDGETIVIGGLFRDVVTTTRNQVPLLGDIPIVGALFRGTTDSTRREEVIILLTPHIIAGAGDTQGEARLADVERKRYGARMGLQGITRAKLAEDHYVKAVQYYADGNSVEALSELDSALDLRPTYLEALRLKEKIIGEASPDDAKRIQRIMLGVIDREEAPNWRRR
ncbi:MAG TPA: secretin N-terminal domain-containing protein [Sedimentisphaerales bacterium]|nr:secretin N-terminal domain-containing protein [Sedimentisphaerales bacterium]